jgi:hypothetical protein
VLSPGSRLLPRYNRLVNQPGGKAMIPIWFFIGLLLIVYGFLIMGQGMWELFNPPARTVVLAELKASIWWGALILVIGGIYAGRYSPW